MASQADMGAKVPEIEVKGLKRLPKGQPGKGVACLVQKGVDKQHKQNDKQTQEQQRQSRGECTMVFLIEFVVVTLSQLKSYRIIDKEKTHENSKRTIQRLLKPPLWRP